MGVAHQIHQHIDAVVADAAGQGLAAKPAGIAQPLAALGHIAGIAVVGAGEHVADWHTTATVVVGKEAMDQAAHGVAAEIGREVTNAQGSAGQRRG